MRRVFPWVRRSVIPDRIRKVQTESAADPTETGLNIRLAFARQVFHITGKIALAW